MNFKKNIGTRDLNRALKGEWWFGLIFVIIIVVEIVFAGRSMWDIGLLFLIFIFSTLGLIFMVVNFILTYFRPFFSKKYFRKQGAIIEDKYSFFLEVWRENLPNVDQIEDVVRKESTEVREVMKKARNVSSFLGPNTMWAFKAEESFNMLDTGIWDFFDTLYLARKFFLSGKLPKEEYLSYKKDFFDQVYKENDIKIRNVGLLLYYKIRDSHKALQAELAK